MRLGMPLAALQAAARGNAALRADALRSGRLSGVAHLRHCALLLGSQRSLAIAAAAPTSRAITAHKCAGSLAAL